MVTLALSPSVRKRVRLRSLIRQEATIACTRLAQQLKNVRPKFDTHEGITSPSIDSGGFRAPAELWLEFDA